MSKGNLIFFNPYRYLLIPQDYIQTDFYSEIKDRASLNAKKNEIFADFIRSLHKRTLPSLKFQLLEEDQNILVMKMGLKKHAIIGTPDLLEHKMDDWHSVYIMFDFYRQMFLVQHKTKVSPETTSLANKILELAKPYVKKSSLNIQINPILKKNLFWDIVKKYDKRIREVNFTLTAPNFANITKHLGEELRSAMTSTTASQAKITLSSDEQSALNLSENDQNIASMARYAQEGGGSFSIRLHGYKRKTSKEGVKELSISALFMEGNERIIPHIKELFNDAEN